MRFKRPFLLLFFSFTGALFLSPIFLFSVSADTFHGGYYCYWTASGCAVSDRCDSGFEASPSCSDFTEKTACEGSSKGITERVCKSVTAPSLPPAQNPNFHGGYYCLWLSGACTVANANSCNSGYKPDPSCSSFTNESDCWGNSAGTASMRGCIAQASGGGGTGADTGSGGGSDTESATGPTGVDKTDFANAQYVITAFENNKPKTIKVAIAGVAYTFTDNNTSDSRINLKTSGNVGFLCSQTTDTTGITLEGSPKQVPGGGYSYSGYVTLNYSGDTNKKCTEGNAQKFLSRTTIAAIYNVPGTESATGPTGDDREKATGPTGDDRDKITGPTGPGFQIKNPLQAGTIPQILDAVANFLFTIGIALVTIMILWGGFQILTSAGSSEQIDKGKRTLLWAVIGTVVILISFGVATLVSNILGGESSPSSSSDVTIGCSFVGSSQGSICQPSNSKCPTGYKPESTLKCEDYSNDPKGCGDYEIRCIK